MSNGISRVGNNLPQMVIQIDESLLRGKRKYNRGRLLLGNQATPQEDQQEYELDIDGNDDEDQNYGNDMRNHGRHIQGPWIFGLAECHLNDQGKYDAKEVRLFHVERRDHQTLIPWITANCTEGSVIWSDQWTAYSRIPNT